MTTTTTGSATAHTTQPLHGTAHQQRQTIASRAEPSKRPRREPTFTTDADGQAIALVPTNRPGFTVKVLADDFAQYQAWGFSHQWTINGDGKGRLYVKVWLAEAAGNRSNLAMVSRLLLNAAKGTRISHRDGNPLNLRRDNLIVGKGFSKGRERAAITAQEAAF